MTEVFLVHQMGLGEFFLCNGLVNYISQFYDKLYLPMPSNISKATVECLYSESRRVKPVQYGTDVVCMLDQYFECLTIPLLVVDCWHYKPPNSMWYKWYYEQFDIPYNYRYEYFSLPKNIPNADKIYDSVVPKNKKYRVVHNGHSGIDSYPLELNSWKNNHEIETVFLDPKITDNLLDWIKIFKNAEEIHVTPSSAFCLVDSIRDLVTPDIFFHDMRATHTPIDYDDLIKNNWKIINYDYKV